jgi:hypothetical protein
MHSYFASPERTEHDALAAEIDFAGKNPVISGLLSSVGGLLAVQQRIINAGLNWRAQPATLIAFY